MNSDMRSREGYRLTRTLMIFCPRVQNRLVHSGSYTKNRSRIRPPRSLTPASPAAHECRSGQAPAHQVESVPSGLRALPQREHQAGAGLGVGTTYARWPGIGAAATDRAEPRRFARLVHLARRRRRSRTRARQPARSQERPPMRRPGAESPRRSRRGGRARGILVLCCGKLVREQRVGARILVAPPMPRVL